MTFNYIERHFDQMLDETEDDDPMSTSQMFAALSITQTALNVCISQGSHTRQLIGQDVRDVSSLLKALKLQLAQHRSTNHSRQL